MTTPPKRWGWRGTAHGIVTAAVVVAGLALAVPASGQEDENPPKGPSFPSQPSTTTTSSTSTTSSTTSTSTTTTTSAPSTTSTSPSGQSTTSTISAESPGKGPDDDNKARPSPGRGGPTPLSLLINGPPPPAETSTLPTEGPPPPEADLLAPPPDEVAAIPAEADADVALEPLPDEPASHSGGINFARILIALAMIAILVALFRSRSLFSEQELGLGRIWRRLKPGVGR